MGFRPSFAPGEWYHCYNRGVEKRRVFEDAKDYDRFLLSLFLANGSHRTHVSNELQSTTPEKIWADNSLDRGEPLVEIGAYCLMPNHFHFLLKEINGGGVTSFMQKVFTGYTMYFNKRHERTGALFAGTFKSRWVADDLYLKHAVSYIHCNPVELHTPAWKEGVGNIAAVEKFLHNYSYSSLPDFLAATRAEGRLLGSTLPTLYDTYPPLRNTLIEAQEYFQEHSSLFK